MTNSEPRSSRSFSVAMICFVPGVLAAGGLLGAAVTGSIWLAGLAFPASAVSLVALPAGVILALVNWRRWSAGQRLSVVIAGLVAITGVLFWVAAYANPFFRGI